MSSGAGIGQLAGTRVTFVEFDPVQPLAKVTVTENVPGSVTMIDCVVAPFDHKYDTPAVAVSDTNPVVQIVPS